MDFYSTWCQTVKHLDKTSWELSKLSRLKPLAFHYHSARKHTLTSSFKSPITWAPNFMKVCTVYITSESEKHNMTSLSWQSKLKQISKLCFDICIWYLLYIKAVISDLLQLTREVQQALTTALKWSSYCDHCDSKHLLICTAFICSHVYLKNESPAFAPLRYFALFCIVK